MDEIEEETETEETKTDKSKLSRLIAHCKKWVDKLKPADKELTIPELVTLDQIFHAPHSPKKFFTPLKFLIFALLFVIATGGYAWIHVVYNQNIIFKDPMSNASQETKSLKDLDKKIPLKKENPQVVAAEVQDTSFTMQPYLTANAQRSLINTINPQFFVQSTDNHTQKVAILIVGLGINQTLTEQIISQMPKSVSLVFSPYTPDLDDELDTAAAEDFVVLVTMPLEDENSTTDQGYLTLKTKVSDEENLEILKKIVVRGRDVDCIYGQGGGRLLRTPERLTPILTSLRQLNNCFVTPPDVLVNRFHEVAAATRLNYVSTTIENPTQNMMPSIKALTQRTGFSVLAFDAKPGVDKTIKQWIKMLEDAKISVVPIIEIIHS
jgi:polysaccharide deacetylase 2 family uncharacterized protein YibQ